MNVCLHLVAYIAGVHVVALFEPLYSHLLLSCMAVRMQASAFYDRSVSKQHVCGHHATTGIRALSATLRCVSLYLYQCDESCSDHPQRWFCLIAPVCWSHMPGVCTFSRAQVLT